MATTSGKKRKRPDDLSPAAEVKRLRERAGLTQRQAAARAGVTDDTWSCWERGVYLIKPLQLEGLRRILGGAK